MLERGELVGACADEDRASEQTARRRQAAVLQRGACESQLRQRGDGRKAQPDDRVAGGKHQRRHHALALARRGIGDLGVGKDHRRGARQHHRQHHRRPHCGNERGVTGTEWTAAERRRANGMKRAGKAVVVRRHHAEREPAERRQRHDAGRRDPLRPREDMAESGGSRRQIGKALVGIDRSFRPWIAHRAGWC